jgi:colanic acid biosynthesis glycosyl transferase WcaI
VTAPPHYPQWRIFNEYSSWQYKREKYLPAPGSTGTVEVFRCPVWIPQVPRGWKRILHLMSFSLSSWPATLRHVFWHPDVVLLIAPTLFCSPQVLCTARLSGAIAWLHVQDFEVDVAFQLRDFSSPQLRRWIHALERFVLRKFDRISAISDRMVERLSTKGVDAARGLLFPNWVDTSVIKPLPAPSPLRRELGIAEQAIVALYSGNMGKKQGLELLIEASRRLTLRPDIQFVFCGDGPYRDTFVRMTEEASNVTILPLQPADRLNELLNLADIHLLPQLADAADLVMPSKLTGMMASGRPVVATALTGTQLSDVLEGRGIITPPGDVNAFVEAVLQLAKDPYLRQRMGEEARKYALAHMDRDEVLRRFELSLMQPCGYSPPESQAAFSTSQTGNLPVAEDLAMALRKGGDD